MVNKLLLSSVGSLVSFSGLLNDYLLRSAGVVDNELVAMMVQNIRVSLEKLEECINE